MLWWALVFLVISLTSGVLGFGGVIVATANVAQLLFVIFMILFALALVGSAIRSLSESSSDR